MTLSMSALAQLFAAGAPSPNDDAVHDRLRDILKRPEFSRGTNLLAMLNDWLILLFSWLGRLLETAPVLYYAIVVVCLLVLALILIHIGWTVRRVFFLPAGSRAAAEGRQARQRLSQAFREEAGRRAQQGDYTEAIRCLFLSLVYHLDEEGRVLFQRSATNREYLNLFADRPRVREGLSVFVDTLDDHWYGQRPTASGQYERCRGLYDDLVRLG
jgi:hypothetical protein